MVSDASHEPGALQAARPPRGPLQIATSAYKAFRGHQGFDLAASLTYYAVLSLFPALLALVSLLGVFGQGAATVDALLGVVTDLGQGDVAGQLRGPIEGMVAARGAGFALAVGIAIALWSASNYVGAFGRALNRIHDTVDQRPFWRLRLLQIWLTVVLVIGAALVLVGLVVSGPITRRIGAALHLGDGALSVWDVAKWPIILVVVTLMVALLYRETPYLPEGSLRLLSVGAVVAIIGWVVASLGLGFYVAHFGTYNRTYGSLAGVIVFLLWLWVTNTSLLFGAELDVELARGRTPKRSPNGRTTSAWPEVVLEPLPSRRHGD